MLKWTKKANGWTATEGPFIADASPKGDGRWNWQVCTDGSPNPAATGIASSAGAAKTACDQYVKRSGRV